MSTALRSLHPAFRRIAMKRTRLGLALTLLVLPAAFAHAENADEAFKRGQDLAAQGKAKEAEAAFEIAWAERKAWDIAGNLGLTEAAQEKWTEAAEHLKFALDNVGGLAKPEHRAGLEKRFEEVRSKVGELRIAAPPGCTIKVGDREVGKTPLLLSVFVTPGETRVIAMLPDHTDDEVTVTVAVKDSKEVKLAPKPVGGAIPTGSGTGLPPEPAPTWPAWVMGGVGIAGVAVGAVGFGLSASSQSEGDDAASALQSSGKKCGDCADIQSSFDDAVTFRGMGIAGMSVGAAAIAGAIIYAVATSSDGEDPEPPATSLRLVPQLGSNNGLFLEGSF